MPTERVYLSQVNIVSEYLTSKTVSTVTDLLEDTGIEPHQYRRMIKAGYDTKSFSKKVLKKTGGISLPACNPRKSKVLKRMKARVKKLFKSLGDKIHSVEDGFRYLGQTFLSKFGIDLGDQSDNKLVEMIS